MISQELGYIFSEAVKFTKKYRHEYISVEHLFLALLENETIDSFLANCGADVDADWLHHLF